MNLFSISSLILCLSSIFFSLIVYRSDRENPVSSAWLYTSICFVGWSLGLYGVTSSHAMETALKWQYILDVSAILLPAFYFNFISELFKFKNYKWRYLIITVSFILAGFSFSSLFKIGVEPKYEFFWVNPGRFYLIFPIYFIINAFISSTIFISQFLKTSPNSVERGQVRNTMIAGLMGYIGGVSNFFPQFFNIYPYGNYLVILFIVFMVYGVLRYKLLSTKVISAQIFSTILVLVFLFNLFRSATLYEWIANFLVLLFVFIFSVFLIRSVNQEVIARNEIESLAASLETANSHLKELDQQKSEFVSLASHQLRGPLTAIKGYASMLLDDDFGPIDGQVRDAVDKMYQSTQDLVVVVGDYLDVSRIEQGRMKYDFTDFDMKELVATTITELRPNIARAKLEISFDYDSTGIFMVNADQGKIRQVVGNLLDNSIKYTPKGSIHVWLQKTLENKILISISDTGVGIRPEVLPGLFEKFTRALDASKTNILGTGLGLYVARKMVEAHGGKVWAESPGQDKGSTFHIELKSL